MSLFLDNVKYAIIKAKQLGCHTIFIEQNNQKFYAQFDVNTYEKVVDKPFSSAIEDDFTVWKSPIVGYIHKMNCLQDIVLKGENYIQIIALGLSYDVPTPFDAEIIEWHIQDGDSVVFGQPIATLKKIKDV